ncbi:MAG: septum formation initiator family protein [Eubacterium sp.]|nr:septum formation initiator family protein [Eubacterium sp.]
MNKKSLKLNKKNAARLSVMALVVVLAVYCAFTLLSNYSDISRLKTQAAKVNAQYEQQVNENDKIRAILSSDNKDEYIEQKAREKGYAKEGEIVFYDISSNR